MKEIYTIGHSNHSIERFIKILEKHQIEVVCDVRSAPYSRYNPQFNRDAIKKELKQHNILYVFLGKELGARSEDTNCYVNGKVQYDRLSRTDLFEQGIQRLMTGIQSYRVALMCAEKDPLTCHRDILICHFLKSKHVDIKHILYDGKIEENGFSERRLLAMLKMHQDLFTSFDELVEKAYGIQAEKIAYVKGESDMIISKEGKV